eukprot:Phypoly_transcript_13285.p1 GENE.Phypoly_transcript_13285~~Phypoly_transcript_13285.p1  ORF type:complete len:132 (-),score=30.42 Phypoly_transcript_13285:79-474(-)
MGTTTTTAQLPYFCSPPTLYPSSRMETGMISKIVVRKGATYLIPPTSPYYANPSSLFAQYEKPRHTSKPPKPIPHPPPLPSSSTNPFDGMEVEEYTIVPSKYKKPKVPKLTTPNPHTTRSVPIQATVLKKS